MAAVGAAIRQHAVVLDLEVRAVEFADLLVSAIHRLGNGDIALLHQVAVDGDGAEQILVMRAGIALLGAALIVAPWPTLLVLAGLYLMMIPVALASYAKVRRRRATPRSRA